MSDGQNDASKSVGTCLTCIYQRKKNFKKSVRTTRLSKLGGGTHCIIDGQTRCDATTGRIDVQVNGF